MWDTSLEAVIFLLRHCPKMLHRHVGNAVAVPAVLVAAAANGSTFTVEPNNDNNDDAQQDQDGLTAGACGPPVQKKAELSR
jgi:hypothetical protein